MSSPSARRSVGRERRGGWRALAIFAGLALPLAAVFARLARGEVIDFRDFLRWTLPVRLAAWRAVRDGRLPEWSPYVDLGAPTLYAPVHGALYPGQVAFVLGAPAVALSVLFIGHLLLTGAGAYWLARRLGCRPEGALCAGLGWELGFQLWMWGCGDKVLSGAWVPWAALALVQVAATPRWSARWTVAGAAALALIATAGDPFLWFHAVTLGGVLAWTVGSPAAGGGVAAGRIVGRTAVVVALAVLLAAPQLLPALALMGDTDRAGGLARAVAERWSLEPARLAALAVLDRPDAGGDSYCAHLYVGLPLVLAAPLARGRAALGLAAIAGLGLVLAVGRHTFVHELLRRALPTI
jgi:hypothetical protein